ncbi:MAG: hypothetical protein ACRC11_14390, partial [Xenococcaceae cyanobacterium]
MTLFTMPRSIADYKNLIDETIARYRDRVDFLSIRLEESEGTSIALRGEQIETLSEGIAIGG